MGKTKMLSPMQARTDEQVCSLNRDNTTTGDFWILSDGITVTITHQVLGESPKASVSVPCAEFNKLVRWYMRGQKIRSKRNDR